MNQKFSLNAADVQRWIANLIVFLAPVALIYLAAVIATINSSGISLASFAPNALTVGAMVLYVLNAVVDIIRKFVSAGPALPATPQA